MIYEVYNTLGFGHRETVYQKALAEEFNRRKIPFEREKKLNVLYKGKGVGLYIPDFVVDGKVILEIKATGFRLGLLANFGTNKLQIIRKVWGNVSVNS